MSFDKPTRNLLAKMVSAARDRLAEDISAQLQSTYGLYPDGSRLDVAQTPEDRHAAGELRALLEHFESAEPEGKSQKTNAYQRLVREIGFTLFNRLAALRLCEERGLVIECVRSGMNSAGFQLYDRLAGGALGNRFQTYQAFIETVFDELAADLGVLFDRRTPQSAVFPSEPAFNDVLVLLNDTELFSRKIWQQDETIGWIYQYYNDPTERKKMRDESQAPRNSRELAVRNQFFTPRYVVEFLTDNTLGRTWYEMRQGKTKLTGQCRYLVQRKHPIFLKKDQDAPTPYDRTTASMGDPDLPGEMWIRPNPEIESISDIFAYGLTVGGYDYAREVFKVDCGELANNRREQYRDTGKWVGSFEELRCCLFFEQRRYHHFGQGPEGEDADAILALYKAVCEQWYREVDAIPFRAKKDPRRLRVLDPACGSGHFLLYAFDLLETIYIEAYGDPELGPDLQDDFPDQANFERQVPRLILENNLHGIDIDPRAAQIAAVALWLRAQRAWQAQKLGPAARPQVSRSHIVVAEPMLGDEELLEEFIADLPKDQHPEIIGPLVRTVFEKMKLAGEAGSLLKIEEELNEAIEQARTAWTHAPQPEQLSFLPGHPKPKQLGLDLSGVTDESFWRHAEELVLHALEDYAWHAENGKGLRRRLFAGDASQGFAFVDLCRNYFDVVLMNPPFGEFSRGVKSYANDKYPETSNDIFAAFIDRFLSKLAIKGELGAITSRNGFFLGTFKKWRHSILLAKSHISAVVDLGQDVMDDAMVEAAAYCLHNTELGIEGETHFIRLLGIQNREEALQHEIRNIEEGSRQPNIFLKKIDEFKNIRLAPFVYWVPKRIMTSLSKAGSLEPDAGLVRCGLSTGNNERFVRVLWEVPNNLIAKRWVPLVMTGSSQPWYSPLLVVVDWDKNGNYLDSYPGSTLRSVELYRKPGISWTRRAVRFIPYVIPSGSIPSASRYMAFPKKGLEYKMLGIAGSNISGAYLRFFGEKFSFPNFLVDTVKSLPWIAIDDDLSGRVEDYVKKQIMTRRLVYQNYEPYQDFLYPKKISIAKGKQVYDLSFDYRNLLSEELDRQIADAYGFSAEDLSELERDMFEAISVRNQNVIEAEDDDQETDPLGEISDGDEFHNLLSYAIGIVFGRWDIRFATGEKDVLSQPDPFSPIPICPPGMLQNSRYFPATIDDVSADYPLRISWAGILSDDEGSPEDVEGRIQEALQIIWHDKFEDIEAQTCDMLNVRNIREYLRKPSGFFAEHLKRYSKSRRQAPIYWPLSSPSGSYTLWVYYHRLTSETLYTAVNRFLSPKIEQVERYLHKLESDLSEVFGRSGGELRDKVDAMRVFLTELNEFRTELLRVANLPYQPDLNDGVIINAAPLYKLFRLGKWSKDCQEVWEKLNDGEYDWAHMAYVLWPQRVREKCKTDKSLAIAHGLEALYQGEEKGKKAKRKKNAKEVQEGLEF